MIHANGGSLIMTTLSRIPALDALRLVGALFVVGLHVGSYDAWPAGVADFVTTSLRWVVPYFFFLSGYFIAKAPDPALAALASLRRMFAIAVAAQLFFLPVVILDVGVKGLAFKLLDADLLMRGIWFHFWYVHAAIMGLLVAVARPEWIVSRRAQAAAVLALLCTAAVDTRFAAGRGDFEMMVIARAFAGVAMLWIGFGLARMAGEGLRTRLGLLGALALIVAALHAYVVASAGGDATKLQLNVGAVAIAALLLLGATASRSHSLAAFGGMGRRYALGLYLFHPAAVFALQRLGVQGPELLWPSAAALTLAALAAAERFAPRLKAFTEGAW